MESTVNIVLTPHVDDEVIGCFGIIDKIDQVWYLNEITEERRDEALACADVFKFTPCFDKEISAHNFSKDDTVYVTSSFDLHKDHRSANREAKIAQDQVQFDLRFYSTNMNRKPKPANPRKKKALELFPSQSALFQDEKYHLFEDIHKSDTIETSTFWCDDYKVQVTISDTPSDVTRIDADTPDKIALELSKVYPDTEVTISLDEKTWTYNI